MADPWELICHHTYSGIPGVIYDTSPRARGHGTAVNLGDSDFIYDGATSGSGAVALQRQGSWVSLAGLRNVPASGVKLEITAFLNPGQQVRGLFGSAGFEFYIQDEHLRCFFGLIPISGFTWSNLYLGTSPSFQLPIGRWAVIGLINDGQGNVEITVDGATVAQKTQTFRAGSLAYARIGETRLGDDSPLDGLIDEVKIWRIDPHHVDRTFLNRPIDSDATDCLKRWTEALKDALLRNPECAEEVRVRASAAVKKLLDQGVNHSPQSRQRWEQAAKEYEELWLQNNLGADLTRVIVDLSDWLALEGIPVTGSQEVQELLASECFERIFSGLPPLDCDPALITYLSQLTRGFADSRSGRMLDQTRGPRA